MQLKPQIVIDRPGGCDKHAVEYDATAKTLTAIGVVYPLTADQAADLDACLEYTHGNGLSVKLADGKLWVRGNTLGAHSHVVGVLSPAPEAAPSV